MPVPLSQMWTVASYVLGQKIRRRKRYPLVLMLEPLFRCNLACAGCGKIQYPPHILKKDMPLEKGLFTPSKYLTFSVHMDGQEEHHDFSVCREGTYQKAVAGVRLAVKMGF